MIPIPFEENQRLAALYDYDVLDTPAEACFDRITRLAAGHFAVPIALISLVDPVRQWFKSRVGLDASETPREISFCGHAILNDGVLQVEDATLDPRFADNPLVTAAPHIRFYAGAPLLTPGGFRLGTLCIIDRRARSLLSDAEEEALQDFAALVVDELEHRRLRQRPAKAQPAPADAKPGEPVAQPDEGAVLVQEAQEDSISSLSHGLRTPLNTIMGFSDMIRRQLLGGIENPNYVEYAGLIHESAEHLLALVDRTLEQATRQQVGLCLDEQWFEPGKAIERSLRMFSEQAQRARIELQSGLGEDLPWLKADRLHLMQMLANVIGNAIKFTRSGGSIRVTAELEPGGTLALCVSDSGTGSTTDNLGRALLPLGRIETEATPAYHGCGPGLSLSKRLIELHGGELVVAGALGEGTTIKIRFPAYRLASTEPNCEPSRAHA